MKLRANTRRTSRTVSIPAPVGGLNARDSYANMPATDAVKMDNWFPLPHTVMLRRGYSVTSSGLGAAVETVMAYNGAAVQKLIGVAGTNFYDCSVGGAVGAAVTTCTNARWQHVNFATAGGYFLSCVNGIDAPKLFDGTTWTNPAITGVTVTDLINVTSHMHRLWYVQKASMKIWYLPVNSIAGAATSIDFSSLFKRGGYLVAMGSWTIDAGSGMDDHAVFITSEGEVAVYRGSDPSSATTWGLVGVYQLGSPVGTRCLTQYASDLLMITQDGLMPMSKALMSSRVNNAVSLTDKIQQLISSDVSLYSSTFGWNCCSLPRENMLILNVPGKYQYAMNTISGSWSRFVGMTMNCMERYRDEIYFGDNSGNICRFWDGNADNGSNIVSEVVQAFSYFNSPNIKHFKLSRPIFNSSTANMGLVSGLNFDFNLNEPVSTPSYAPSTTAGVWGVSKWGAAQWVASGAVRKEWQTSGGIGYCAGMHISTSSNKADIQWQSTTHIFEIGNGL